MPRLEHTSTTAAVPAISAFKIRGMCTSQLNVLWRPESSVMEAAVARPEGSVVAAVPGCLPAELQKAQPC